MRLRLRLRVRLRVRVGQPLKRPCQGHVKDLYSISMRYLKDIYTICIRYVSVFDPQPAILLLCAGLLAFSKASETGANRPLSIIFPLIGVGFDQLDMGAIDQLLSRVWKIHCYIHAND
jgi:hypothetical protein